MAFADAGMKVHLTSCETGNDAIRLQEKTLRHFWNLSDKRHSLTDDPEVADCIIVADLQGTDWFASLRMHPVVDRFPEKCFVISETDHPMPLLRGVYASAHRGMWFPSRFRSGAYNLYHPDFKNPVIENYTARAWEQPKSWLCSFAGRDSHRVRVAIFAKPTKREDIFVRHTWNFNAWARDADAKLRDQEEFKDILEKSKFALCPRGGGTSSIRLFEAMKMGVAPIILSDDWIFPKGPRWEDFAIVMKERDVSGIEEVAIQNEHRYREMGAAAAEAYNRYFADSAYFNYLVDQFADIAAKQRIPEPVFWKARGLILRYWRIKRNIRDRYNHVCWLLGKTLERVTQSDDGA